MVENRYACFEEIRALEKAIFGKKPFDNVSSLKESIGEAIALIIRCLVIGINLQTTRTLKIG